MSLPQETLMQLMALADGELEGEELSRAEALVAGDLLARQVLESMRTSPVGQFLRDEWSVRTLEAQGIAESVMAQLDLEPSAKPADAVATAAAAGGQLAPQDARPAAQGAAVVRLPTRRPRAAAPVLGGVVAGALALAAGVALYFGSVSGGGDGQRSPVANVGTLAAGGASSGVLPAVGSTGGLAAGSVVASSPLPSQGVEVDEVDSPSRGFAVFEIPVAGAGAAGAANVAGPSSVVVMIDDDPGAH